MLKLITEDKRVLENHNFKLNFTLKTDCVMRSDSDFTKLRTDSELRGFMDFYRIDRRQYGTINASFAVVGKIHIALPKGQFGGSYCMRDGPDSVLVEADDVKDYPPNSICLVCIKKVRIQVIAEMKMQNISSTGAWLLNKKRDAAIADIKAENNKKWNRRVKK